jgi:hypothetical protein
MSEETSLLYASRSESQGLRLTKRHDITIRHRNQLYLATEKFTIILRGIQKLQFIKYIGNLELINKRTRTR